MKQPTSDIYAIYAPSGRLWPSSVASSIYVQALLGFANWGPTSIRTTDEYVQHFPAESQMFDKWTLTEDMINILGRLSKTRAGCACCCLNLFMSCACCCLNLFMSWRPALAGTPIQLVKLTIRSTAVSAASVIQYRKTHRILSKRIRQPNQKIANRTDNLDAFGGLPF